MNTGSQYKQCPQCGNMDAINAGFCSRCGQQYSAPSTSFFNAPPPQFTSPAPVGQDVIQMPPGAYDPTLAIVLAAIFSGWIGMIINKQVIKGVVMLIGGLFFTLLTGGLGFLVIYPLGLIDVILIANRLKRGEAVGPWQWF